MYRQRRHLPPRNFRRFLYAAEGNATNPVPWFPDRPFEVAFEGEPSVDSVALDVRP
jgi:hypothetical protein